MAENLHWVVDTADQESSSLLEESGGNVNIVGPTLEELKSMFCPDIESEVVDMIWQDSNKNGQVALGYLCEISPAKEPQMPAEPPPVVNSSWCKILDLDGGKPFTEPLGVRPKQFAVKEEPKSVVNLLKERIQRSERIVIIMRGAPGTGKSTLAQLVKGRGVVLSTDHFFYNRHGEYIFNPGALPEAHEWNRKRADRELKAGTNPVVIDNTNLEPWEMQPYIYLALRYAYSVELVEPDTPWRNDVRMLAQKNTHKVPREKISMMVEKQKVPIDIASVVEECRRKMNNLPSARVVNQPVPTVPVPKLPVDLVATSMSQPINGNWRSRTPSSSSSSNHSSGKDEWSLASPSIAPVFPPLGILPDVAASATNALLVDLSPPPACVEIGIQTSLSDPTLSTLDCKSRSIQSSRIVPNFNRASSSKFMLDKGCNTEEFVEDVAPSRKSLSILKSYFPTMSAQDLADVLDQCNGDLTWAVNLLLDSGYECASEVFTDDAQLEDDIGYTESELQSPEAHPLVPRDEETYSCTSSEASSSQQSSSTPSASSSEVESVRKHVEECFKLTDTLSDQARRICGKEDYSKFRASQISKARHPTPEVDNQIIGLPIDIHQPSSSTDNYAYSEMMEGDINLELYQPLEMASPPTSSEDEVGGFHVGGAMIPMTLEPSFVNQLVSLFGAPDMKRNGPSNRPVSFDIPWSLAEQIYMHWCASLVSEEEENDFTVTDENRELQSIMDVEFAMKLAQDEKMAQKKELRENLSTKLSLQMLRDNYPQVDPTALETLFEENNYNYSHTVTALNASLGTKPRTLKPLEPITSSKDESSSNKKRETKVEESRDLRSEAFMYNRLRKDYATKARENHNRGLSAVATYYASESKRYADLYKECNQKAALQIVEEKNARQDERTIDLHELHVQEALSLLESFIVQNVRDGKTVIHVITGKGNNSVNGRPRIKPAVITFLRQKKYAFEEANHNAGMLRVFLRRRQ